MLLRILFITFAGALAASWAYWIIAWWSTRRFFSDEKDPIAAPRHAAEKSESNFKFEISDFLPSISVLKPVKGVDPRAAENFGSFLCQSYPQYEVMFGVAREDDPAVVLIHRMLEEHPEIPIRLIVAAPAGANPKSSTLQRLAAEATREILVISDADIRVPPDYLARVVAPLADPAVGLVTCLYRGAGAQTLPARLESLHMGVMFLPSAIVAHELLGQCVGMGATLALRKSDLLRLGGYESFRDHLMDDYQLADRVRKLGLQTVISNCVVESVLGRTRCTEQWQREVRWARGIRITTPWSYPGLLLTYPIVLAMMLVLLRPLHLMAWTALAASIAFRWITAWDIARCATKKACCDTGVSPVLAAQKVKENMQYGSSNPNVASTAGTAVSRDAVGPSAGWRTSVEANHLYLLPLRELLSFAVWCAGLVGRTITWRGQRFLLHRDGRLQPAQNIRRDPLSRFVRRLDQFLRRREGIFEYSDSADCILRVSIGACERSTDLRDGTKLVAGDAVADLHFWNDHMPPIPADGPGLSWAQSAIEQARRSLRLLADAIERDPRFGDVKAIRAKSVFTPRGGVRQLQRLADKMYFELREPAARMTVLRRLHHWGENLLIWALIWTFNRDGLRGARLNRRRTEFWISRGELMERYGKTHAARSSDRV